MSRNDRHSFPDPREEDIVYGDRRISRPDVSLPDWEVPDTSYRPVPIVWFTGALLIQLVAVSVSVAALGQVSSWLAIALIALATGAIGKWTWDRGMKDAGTGWRVATIAMLAFGLLYGIALTDLQG